MIKVNHRETKAQRRAGSREKAHRIMKQNTARLTTCQHVKLPLQVVLPTACRLLRVACCLLPAFLCAFVSLWLL